MSLRIVKLQTESGVVTLSLDPNCTWLEWLGLKEMETAPQIVLKQLKRMMQNSEQSRGSPGTLRAVLYPWICMKEELR